MDKKMNNYEDYVTYRVLTDEDDLYLQQQAREENDASFLPDIDAIYIDMQGEILSQSCVEIDELVKTCNERFVHRVYHRDSALMDSDVLAVNSAIKNYQMFERYVTGVFELRAVARKFEDLSNYFELCYAYSYA